MKCFCSLLVWKQCKHTFTQSCSDIDLSEEEESSINDEEIEAEYVLPGHASYHSLANGVSTTPHMERRILSGVTPTSNHDVDEQNGDMATYFQEETRGEVKLIGDQLNETKVNGDKLNEAKLNGEKRIEAKLNGVKPDGAKLEGIKLDQAKLNGTPALETVDNEDIAKREMSFSDVLQNPVELEHFKVCAFTSTPVIPF